MTYLSNKKGMSGFAETVTESGTSRTLVLTDAGKYIRVTNAGAKTITVPPQASVAWEIGTVITFRNAGAGELSFAEGAGVTVTPDDIVLDENGTAQIILVTENNWDFI